MKRPYLSVETSEEVESQSPSTNVLLQKKELKDLLFRFVVRGDGDSVPTGSVGQPTYPWLISFLAPMALEYQRKTRGHFVISLDDQLEWQETSRSHSPKAPTPPQIMRSLRETPPVSPKESSEEDTTFAELDAFNVARAIREVFVSPEGVASLGPRFLTLSIPSEGSALRIRAEARAALPAEVLSSEDLGSLTAADLWLLGVAVSTLQSNFAATVRSRRSLASLSDSLVLKIKNFLFSGASPREAELDRRREACETATRKRRILEERIKDVQTKIERLEKQRKMRADRDIAVSLLKKPRLPIKALALAHTATDAATTGLELTTTNAVAATARAPELVAETDDATAMKTSEDRELAVEWLRLNFRARELAEMISALNKKSHRISLLLAETSKRILAQPIKTPGLLQ